MSLLLKPQQSFDHTISKPIWRFPGIFITLKGDLPPELIDTKVPLQISLSLPEPYRSFLEPVVNEYADSVDPETQTEIGLANDDSSTSPTPSSKIPDPPCLELSSAFNHQSTESWTNVYKDIGQWMGGIRLERGETEDWQWGWEAYWMAFVAAFPHFPSGAWSNWDPAIALDGPFITEWVGRGGSGGRATSFEQEARDEVWQRF
ncbi:protein kinase, partial [Marasmius sp. AFHP31]